MTTMTIHVEDFFAEALRTFAEKSGKSVNQTVKAILAPVLGLAKDDAAAKADDPFMELCGVLPKDEVRRLKKVLAEQRQIDEEMWK